MNTDELRQSVVLAFNVLKAVMETIKEAGKEGAPEQAIYLAVAERGLTLEAYTSMRECMLRSGLVCVQNHTFYWVGP